MTDTPQNTTGAYDLLGERRQEGISFAPASSGTGLKVSPKTRENFGRSAAPQDKPQADTAVAAGSGGYDQQNFFVKFLINILMMLTGKLDADNKGNNSLIGLISKAFGMNDDADHTEFRQLQGDLKTRGRETVRRERDYSRFDTGAAVAAVKMGEPILGKNIYNSQMLELIGKGESGGDYNIVNSKAQRGIAPPKPLTEMTINEVLEWQRAESGRQRDAGDKAPSSAAGKYQFIRATLDDTRRSMGLSGKEKFDQAMQDKMAMHLLNKNGYEAFMKGRISESEMVRRVAGTWSSVADLNGRSAHEGIGNNAASISVGRTIAAARQDQTILASSFSGASTGAPRPPATTNPIVVADGGKPSTSTTFAAASAGTQPAAAAPVVNVAAAVVESAQNNARRQQPAGATLG